MNIEIILSGAISGAIGSLATYVILRKVVKDTVFQLKDEVFDLKKLQNDEDLQKLVFSFGGLFGKGARTGIGMDRKLNPKDVLLNMAMDWWQDRRQGNTPTGASQRQTREEDPLRIQ